MTNFSEVGTELGQHHSSPAERRSQRGTERNRERETERGTERDKERQEERKTGREKDRKKKRELTCRYLYTLTETLSEST